MGGLLTSLLTGVQALEATQGALNATSNNIANADTPGYTREVPEFSENAENFNSGQLSGGGVSINSIQSVRDELLYLEVQNQTAQQSSAGTQSSFLNQVQTGFANTGDDLASTFSAFSSSLDQLSANPGNPAVEQSVYTAGQNLADSFNTTSAGLASVQSAADQQVTQTVAQINTLTKQIAQLNAQLTPAVMSQQNGGTIEDQRDQLVQQLSTLTGISVTQSSDGQVITTGNGTPLVMGGQSYSLQTTTGLSGFQQVLDSNGNDITSTIQGGQLGGAIQTRDVTIPGYLQSLNTLASQFATAMNAAQAQGFDSTGAAGQPFFSVPANPADAASGITVAISSGAQVAGSSDGTAGSNGNVAKLSAVLTSNLPSGQTPAGAYSSIVFQVGSDASNASAQSSAIGQSLLQLTNQQGSVSGVSIDEESTNLIRYQTAYEAAARIVSTIEALNTVTLDMGSSQSY